MPETAIMTITFNNGDQEKFEADPNQISSVNRGAIIEKLSTATVFSFIADDKFYAYPVANIRKVEFDPAAKEGIPPSIMKGLKRIK